MSNNEALEALTKEQLIEFVTISSKNLIAVDGTWFQSVERECGMDAAMHHDEEAWRRFTVSEAKRLKQFLGLPEQPGLEGLEAALALKLNTLSSTAETRWENGSLVYRVVECRVQAARSRKGMELHPCKSVGLIEYEGFARTIDERISCECVSCFPAMTDQTCSCSWRFTLDDDGR